MKPAFIQLAAALFLGLLGAPSLAVAQSTTTTTLTNTPSATNAGQAVTLSATVKGQGGGMPTGSIIFKEGANTIGTVAVELESTKTLAGQIGLGGGHACALTTNGGGRCWGETGWGQTGNGAPGGLQTVPLPVSGDGISTLTSGAKQIVAGGLFSCAITDVNDVVCWGANYLGQLGNGTTVSESRPVRVQGSAGIASKIASGMGHSCIVTTSGGVKCWGLNTNGQLGRDNAQTHLAAFDVTALTSGVRDIALGSEHSCALMANGGVKCWGSNFYGSLGNGSTNGLSSQTPLDVALPANTTATAIFAGGFSACAQLNTGAVHCWGRNDQGQLGDGSTSNRVSPVPVVNASGIKHLAIGTSHACAALADGTAKCWGRNINGELGNGTTNDSLSGVTVSSLSNVLIVAIPPHQVDNYTCAVTRAGTISCWGSNSTATLARGTSGGSEPLPAPISNQPDPTISSVARLVTTTLPVGVLSLTAEYMPTSNHNLSTGTATHTVSTATTTTTVTTTPSTSQPTQAINMVATVTSPGNAATGAVFFYFDNTYVGTGNLNGGTASLTIGPWTSTPGSAPAVGTHLVRAQYAGQGGYMGSTSADHTHTVSTGAATITLTRSPNAATVIGQSLTLTATVNGTPKPTGSVTFKRGTSVLGVASLVNGVARFSTASLSATTHSLTATYGGNSVYGPVTSTTLSHVVTKFTPTVTLSASPAGTSGFGQVVEFSARVTGNASGSVTFKRGSTVFGTASVVNGVARLRVSTLPIASHVIRATYNGNASLNPATSAAMTHLVRAATRTTLAPIASIVKPGQAVTLTATVTKVNASAAALTGQIAFMRGTTTIRVVSLVNGRATLTTTLPIGEHIITVAYSGSTTFAGSVSAVQRVEVGYAKGQEFRVSVATHHDQKKPAVAALDDHAVAVWMGQMQANGPYGLFARLFNEGGLPNGGEITVAAPSYSINNPSISGFGRNFAVAWEASGGGANHQDIFIRIYRGRTALGAARRVNTLTANDQVSPVAFQAGGNLVVVWKSFNAAKTKSDIYARVFDGDGDPFGPEFRVHDDYLTETAFAGTGTRIRGVTLGLPTDTGFVVGWLRSNGFRSSIPMAQRFDLLGGRVGGAITLSSRADIDHLSLSALPVSQFVATWDEIAGNPASFDVRTRIFNESNVAQPATSVTGGPSFTDVKPVMGKLGSYNQNAYGRALAFLSTRSGQSQARVMVQAYSATGPLLATPFPLDSGKSTTITEIAAADLGRGWNTLVIWNAYGQDGHEGGIYGRLVSAP